MGYRPTAMAHGVAMALLLPSLGAAAQQLDDVQVTANRLPQSQADVLASTTIIDRAEIERSQADSVIDLLQNRAGIEITQNGAHGTITSLFMRGTESDHTLVLVDGVRINAATSGGASLEFLPVEAIQRIEIVRGPRAAAYGADAIGGVIQIFTRRGGEGTQAALSLRAGDQHTQKQNLFVSTGDAATRLNASLFRRDGDGFNALASDASGERDGFKRGGAQLGLSHRFGANASLSLNALRQDTDADYDDCFPLNASTASNDCRTDGYLQTFGGRYDLALAPDWDMAITAGHFDERREERYAGERYSVTESHRNELGIQHSFTRANGVDTLGVDYRQEHVDFDSASPFAGRYAKDSRENYGLYGMLQREYGRHELSGSLRYDDDSRFGDETTGSAGYAYRLTPAQRLGLVYSTAFKAPNLIDLYGPYGSNPDLDAETSRNLEAFWAIEHDAWHARVSAFENRIDDLIAFDAAFVPYNVDRARIRGVELSGGWQYAGLSLRASLTHQDPEDRDSGERLKRRARTFGRLDADYALGDWRYGATLRAAGDRRDTRYTFPYGDTTVSGYGIVDLRTAWQVTPQVELSAKLDNAFDRDYTLAEGYNTQGRYVEAGVKLTL
ncbi:TonB-dependent receptor [Salinicola sp. JS01]|uniref:TonB-dependent receptor domain-containing protein n=1 Tax=Salinicola sp. JS01 TaxID=3050071 RepID=UPI00255BFAF2|nr:TonB-dependent receptor [Salinicola sp. JS01]WIX31278.1 TonB-dependent receptor [Salinicola sp. JS01]